jgi:hypothetical protein
LDNLEHSDNAKTLLLRLLFDKLTDVDTKLIKVPDDVGIAPYILLLGLQTIFSYIM